MGYPLSDSNWESNQGFVQSTLVNLSHPLLNVFREGTSWLQTFSFTIFNVLTEIKVLEGCCDDNCFLWFCSMMTLNLVSFQKTISGCSKRQPMQRWQVTIFKTLHIKDEYDLAMNRITAVNLISCCCCLKFFGSLQVEFNCPLN